MNLLQDRQLKRLYGALEFSRRRLQPFREKNYEMYRQYVGFNYSDNGAADKVPVNFLELAVNIYIQQLAARSPRAMVNSYHSQLGPFANILELAVNHLLDEICFDQTLRKVVLNAIFSIGITKTGIERISETEINGFTRDFGQPFCESISLDNWVHDTTATTFERCSFMGDRYRVPLEYVKEAQGFDKKAREALKASEHSAYNEGGDSKVASLSHGSQTGIEEYKEHVELWDLWLPYEGLFVTLPAEGEGKPLRVIKWDGPESGPYDVLAFNPLPLNLMPLSPASLWLDLHDLMNRLFRKLGRQAERQKTVLGVQSGAEDDGVRIINSNDGEALKMDNPDRAREYKFGGIDQASLAFTIQAKDLFSYVGGNLDTLGGLSPMADTLGQDQLLAQNASKRVAEMQDAVISFTRRVVKKLAYYLWTDPLIELPLTKRLPVYDSISVPVTFSPETMEGDFLDYNFDIEPYSMQHQSPQMKLQTLTQVMTQFVLPMMPALQEQGVGVDMPEFLKVVAKYANVDELNHILDLGNGQSLVERKVVGSMPQKNMPITTKHISERVNRPGATQQGKDAAQVQMLLGGNVQPAEKAAIRRPVG